MSNILAKIWIKFHILECSPLRLSVGNIQQSETESRYIYKYVHRTHKAAIFPMSTPLQHKWVIGVEFQSFLALALNGGE